MNIVAFCVRNPVTVMVGILLAILFGAIALFRLPIQMIPTVDRPEITVETEYRGAAPLEVEREVTGIPTRESGWTTQGRHACAY